MRDGSNCQAARTDYFECLHHVKEHKIINTIISQEKLNQASGDDGSHGGGGH